MKKKILTISVAAYNMEAYLSRCIDSILIPDICSDIEVIMVNDSSYDNYDSKGIICGHILYILKLLIKTKDL